MGSICRPLYIAHIIFISYVVVYLLNTDEIQTMDLLAFLVIFVSGQVLFVIHRLLSIHAQYDCPPSCQDSFVPYEHPFSFLQGSSPEGKDIVGQKRRKTIASSIFVGIGILYLAAVFPTAMKGVRLSSRELVRFRHQDEAFIKDYSGKMLDDMTLNRWQYPRGSDYGYGGSSLNLALLPLFPFRRLIQNPSTVAFTALRIISVLSGLALLLTIYCYAYRRHGVFVAVVSCFFVGTLPAFYVNSFHANTPDVLSALFMTAAILLSAIAASKGWFRLLFLAAALSGAAHATKSMGFATLCAVMCIFVYALTAARVPLKNLLFIKLPTGILLLLLGFVAGIGLFSPYLLLDFSISKSDFAASLLYFGDSVEGSSGLVFLPGIIVSDPLRIWKEATSTSMLDVFGVFVGIVWSLGMVFLHIRVMVRARQPFAILSEDSIIALWILAWVAFITFFITSYHSGRMALPALPLLAYGFAVVVNKAFVSLRKTSYRVILGTFLLICLFLPALHFIEMKQGNILHVMRGWGNAKWAMITRYDAQDRISEQLEFCVKRVTNLFDRNNTSMEARIGADSYYHLPNDKYKNFTWGYCCIPQGINPDILILDEHRFFDYYTSLTDETIRKSTNPTFFQRQKELYHLFWNDEVPPYVHAYDVPPPYPGRIFAAPWARMKNILTEGNVIVTTSSSFYPSPNSPEDIFLAKHRGIGAETYAAGMKRGGRQFFEFYIKNSSSLSEQGLAYVVIHWLSKDNYAKDFALLVRECDDWKYLIQETDWRPGNYYTDYYSAVNRPVHGDLFRFETTAYQGQQRILLKGIDLYVNQVVDILALGNTRITKSSHFFPSPHSPQDIFNRVSDPKNKNVYAAGVENGGIQFFEFEIGNTHGLDKVDLVEIEWYNTSTYAKDFSLMVMEDSRWTSILAEKNWTPMGDYPILVRKIERPLQGNRFRFETTKYEGQNRMLLRRISLYRPPIDPQAHFH